VRIFSFGSYVFSVPFYLNVFVTCQMAVVANGGPPPVVGSRLMDEIWSQFIQLLFSLLASVSI